MKKPEEREENQQDPLERIREIDELFRNQQFMVVEDENREEITWDESEDAKQLLEEKAKILKDNADNTDFTLAFAAYQAPREGKQTAEHKKFIEVEKGRLVQHINDLKESLRKAEESLKKLERE